MSIVGFINYSNKQTPVYWKDSSITTLPISLALNGGGGGYASGINNSGSIVGSISYGSKRPVYWKDSLATTLPISLALNGGGEGYASSINNSGNIVGTIFYDKLTPVYWTDALATTLPTPLSLGGGLFGYAYGINESGQIVGNITYPAGLIKPVYWKNYLDTPTPLSLGAGSFGYAYGINASGQIVGTILYNDGSTKPAYWKTYLDTPTSLDINEGDTGYAYDINSLGQIVGYVTTIGVTVPAYWSDSLNTTLPTFLNLNGQISGEALGISDPKPTPTPTPTPTPIPIPVQPISNICFPAGTPIKTDQGLVAIDHIDTRHHTIGHKRILDITQTVSLDRFLVMFPKDCIELNLPNADTIMTKEHKVLYKGKMLHAYKFLNISSEVKRIKYTGEVLYNVLQEEYGTMNVNNLICETLHPDNLIAKIYRNRFTDTYNDNVIFIMNYSLDKRNYYAYKSIINRIHSTRS
jgi:hypothetical protein